MRKSNCEVGDINYQKAKSDIKFNSKEVEDRFTLGFTYIFYINLKCISVIKLFAVNLQSTTLIANTYNKTINKDFSVVKSLVSIFYDKSIAMIIYKPLLMISMIKSLLMFLQQKDQ